MHGTDQPIKECPLIKAGQSLQQKSIELQINERWFEVVVDPILGAKGNPSKYIHIITDITESELAKTELFVQSARIKTFFNSINDAIFVHPLKQKGFAPFVEVNDIACKRYGYTHDELMTLSAPDITVKADVNEHANPDCRKKLIEKKQLIFETFHIKKSGEIFPVEINSKIFYQNGEPYILAVVRDITDRKNAENIVLEADFPNQGPMIYGNENQIQQLVTNLVTNAAESYQKKGTIYLSVKTVLANEIPKKHRFPVGWMPDHDDYACLAVADDGCGIEEENIEKIFDPFFSTKATGRGLDLPVVLGIAQANNGVITVEGRRDEGSTFRFFTPVETKPDS